MFSRWDHLQGFRYNLNELGLKQTNVSKMNKTQKYVLNGTLVQFLYFYTRIPGAEMDLTAG